MSGRYETFSDFYPFYLSEHRDPRNRRMHFIGTSLAILAIIVCAISTEPWWLVAGFVAAYFCAWFGHFYFEKNRPATFRFPVYSLMGDWVMYKDLLTGKLKF